MSFIKVFLPGATELPLRLVTIILLLLLLYTKNTENIKIVKLLYDRIFLQL
jgi:hypothetical protein